MDLIAILTTVILATTIGTVIIGVAAYAAFKLRDKRKPKAKVTTDNKATGDVPEPIFLKRYMPTSQVSSKVSGAVVD